MATYEKPSSPSDMQWDFLIGREAGGSWLAVERHGLAAGIFSSMPEALRFINSDFHGPPGPIEIIEEVVESFDRPFTELVSRYGVRGRIAHRQ